jgi:Ca2+-binding RTX toxin-like protein
MGAGADRVIFAAGNLTSGDTLVGGDGVDSISFTAADTLGDAVFTNVTTFEALVLANGSNQVGIGAEFIESGLRVIYGGTGADSVSFAADTLAALGSGLTLSLGSGIDTVNLTNAATIADSKFGGMTGVEVVDLADSTGNVITLGDSAQAAGIRVVFDGAAGDTIDASGYTAAVTVVSSDGNDWIRLGSGNDSISIPEAKLSSDDTLVGGSGVDTLGFSSAGTIVDADFSKVTSFEAIQLADISTASFLTLAGAADTLGLSSIFGGSGADSVVLSGVSSSRGLYISLGSGADSLTAGPGADSVLGQQDDAVLDGGSGTDRLLIGSSFNDVSDSQIVNFEQIFLSSAGLLFSGDSQTEALYVTGFASGASSIVGGAGADTLIGGTGADSLMGGDGADVLFGSAEDLLLDGGAGADILSVSASFNDVNNSQITNIEQVALTSTGLLFSADSQTEALYVIGFAAGVSTIVGGSGADTLLGGTGADSLLGGAGADSVDGGNGADVLNLGTGSDVAYLGDSDSGIYWSADTLGDGLADLVVFSLSDIGTADSLGDVVFNFTVGLGADSIGGYIGYNLADSISGWVEGGFLLNGSGADTAFADLSTAINVIEANDGNNQKYDLDANEVFLFRVGTDSYVGTTDGTKVTSVVKLVGIAPASASFDLKESPTTDGIFYIGPNGG